MNHPILRSPAPVEIFDFYDTRRDQRVSVGLVVPASVLLYGLPIPTRTSFHHLLLQPPNFSLSIILSLSLSLSYYSFFSSS